MKKALLILFVAVASLTACKKDLEDKFKERWNLIKKYSTEHIDNVLSHESNETFNVGKCMWYLKTTHATSTRMEN